MKNENKSKKVKMNATRLICLIIVGLMLVGTISAAVAIIALT